MVTLDFGSARTLLSMSGTCLVSIFIVFFYHKLHKRLPSRYQKFDITPPQKKRAQSQKSFVFFHINTINLHINIGVSLVTFGAMLLFEAALNFVLYLAKVNTTSTVAVKTPQGLCVLIAVLSVTLSAAGEELLYRVFFPSLLRDLAVFFSREKEKVFKVLRVFALVLGALAFALPHYYLGAPSVLNALFCHGALLLCLKKTRSPAFPIAVHASFNLFTLFLMAML